jgi:pyrroloquinoline quinone (PQQ) biosynthesis protein C
MLALPRPSDPARPRLLGAASPEVDAQRRLNALNQRRMRPTLYPVISDAALDLADRQLEDQFLAEERTAVRPLIARAPDDPDGFVRWFEDLRDSGPGQGDPLFPWLAQDATREQMRWFLGQEVAGEAGFEDLLALTQLRMPARAKLEMARNYWDELGRGHAGGVHGGMLHSLATALAVRLPVEQIVWPALALANLMVSMAWHRHFAFQAVGALGVIELTAPGRAEQVNAGLVRLGVPADARRYFALHATLDVRHSRAWNDEVIRPLIAEDPRRARAIAEGALLRLHAGARCFASYRRQLMGPR